MNLRTLFVHTLFLLCAAFVAAQTAVVMPQPKIQFLDANGHPLAGGCVNTYAAGTTINQATYKDSTSSAVNTNPVILDSAGRASIFTTRGVLYKVVVTSFGGTNCSTGTLQYTQDNIPSGSSLVVGGANGQVQYNGFGTLAASPNFTWNNGSATLSVGALNTNSGGFLGGSFAGNPIWTGGHTFNGTAAFPGGVVGSLKFTDAGIFTNTQMNVLASSSINGINFGTEYQAAQGANFSTEGFAAGVSIPGTSTVHQADGIAGYVTNSSTSTNGVGVYSQCRSLVNNTACWGANFVSRDVAGLTTGITLYGNEIDVNPFNALSAYSGVTGFLMSLNTTATGTFPGNGAFYVTGSTNARWFIGYQTADDAAATGVQLGGACASSGTCSSQAIKLRSFNGGVLATTSVSSDATGNVIIAPAAGQGVKVNTASVPVIAATGTATVDLASVASGACTADSADMTLTGASVGDPVRVTSAIAITAGTWLIGRVTAANTGRFQYCNLSGGAVDRASDTYTISVVK